MIPVNTAMRHIARCLTAVLLLAPVAVSAQVPRVSPALRLAEVEQDQGTIRYAYEVVGLAAAGEVLSDVYLEIASPKADEMPRVTGTDGKFLFDAIAESYQRIGHSHPPVAIRTPQAWSAAIYVQGVLSWGASRYLGGVNYGVQSGKRLGGFELRSTALPALRRYSVIPARPPRHAGAAALAVDSAHVLLTGIVLAPGWPRDQVSGAYLREQMTKGCEARWIDNCGRYLRHLDSILAAEEGGSDRRYNAAMNAFRETLASDRTSHSHARFVLESAALALVARPPSQR